MAASGCPYATALAAQQASEAAAAPSGGCPLGFSAGGGGARGGALSALDCPVCRAMVYQPVRSKCGHKFCAACLSRFRDCPVCGADVAPGEAAPDAELAATADAFAAAHRDVPLPGGAAGGAAALAEAGGSAAAAFWLHLGLRSMAGGNFDAAACRLALALAELRAPPPGDAAAAGAEAACRLGAVQGALGDARRRMGDDEAALAAYVGSAEELRPYAAADTEAAHALSVSLNKIGDLHYGRVAARSCRRRRCVALLASPVLAPRRRPFPQQQLLDSSQLPTHSAPPLQVRPLRRAGAIRRGAVGARRRVGRRRRGRRRRGGGLRDQGSGRARRAGRRGRRGGGLPRRARPADGGAGRAEAGRRRERRRQRCGRGGGGQGRAIPRAD